MSRFSLRAIAAAAVALSASAALCAAATPDKRPDADQDKSESHKFEPFKPESVTTEGSVTVGGKSVAYQAIAGTLIVHPSGWDDVPQDPSCRSPVRARRAVSTIPPPRRRCSTSPTSRKAAANRPVTFLYNGGPGSATLWLHMGAFGPRRIVTSTDAHTPAAPYSLVNNASSLLDATDLVFIDAPGTGFSRIAGKDKEKAFFGVDQDAYAFAEFITQFLSKYGRWNSPKYLFGESYGTPRSAVLINQLEADRSIDFNGVILLSQILSFDLSPDRPTGNPGIDLPYETVLPTYAATAWYHKKLPASNRRIWRRSSAEVEQFAMGEYARALAAGSQLSTPGARRHRREAARLHRTAGRLHPEGRPAHRRRGVPPDAAGGHRVHHGPARHPLLRA